MSGYVCPKCGHHDDIFGTGGGERTAAEMSIRLLGKVPIDSSVVRAGDQGLPSLSEQSESAAALAFKKVVEAVRASLEESAPGRDTALSAERGATPE
jgi:ATP-binding protein involved in chromosome partitioning